LFREQLPPQLAGKVLDVLRLDTQTPEREVLDVTLAALRQNDAESDAELAARLLDEARSEGLGVIGAEPTLAALQNGQVDVLLIPASSDLLTNVSALAVEDSGRAEHTGNAAEGLAAVDTAASAAAAQPEAAEPAPAGERVANRLVTLARQTSASVRFIEDPLLLAEAGGVGALLRFRV
jgi:peptide subunit release factor 1 (eRF1)